MDESSVASENPARLTIGAIIASAAIAAAVAFFLRRALRADDGEESYRGAASEPDFEDTDLRERAVAATGDFLRSHVAPEVKPMLLTVLKDVKDYVEKGFQRAEQSIKDL